MYSPIARCVGSYVRRIIHYKYIVSGLSSAYLLTNMNGKSKDTVRSQTNGVGLKTPFLIGVAGGTASGKSTVCKRIMERLGQADIDHSQRRVVCIAQDAFYRDLSEEESARAAKGAFNFDHPDAFDIDLILKTLKKIQAGQICNIPNYDFVTNSRLATTTTIYTADVVMFEGILMFYHKEIRDLFHMKLFVDSDADTRLARRVMRDTRERGRTLETVLNQYTNLVKPAFEEFCLPTKKFADVIIPRGAENTVAINLIVLHIQEIMNKDGATKTNGNTNTNRHFVRSFSDGNNCNYTPTRPATTAVVTTTMASPSSSSSSTTMSATSQMASMSALHDIMRASSGSGPPILSPSSAASTPLPAPSPPALSSRAPSTASPSATSPSMPPPSSPPV